jgi:hypothetical protein
MIRSPIPRQFTYRYIAEADGILPVKLPETLIERIKKVGSLNPTIKEYIRRAINDSISNYSFMHPLADEEMLFNLNKENVKTYATNCGMIIPLLYHDNPIRYYLDNFDSYRFVTKGSKIMHRRTDAEIFKNLGVYLPYSSRRDLLSNVEQYLSVSGVMVFTMQTSSLLRKAKNKEISTLETLHDLIESKERIICIGNIKSFNCLTCSELIHLWNSNFDNAKYQYSLPYQLDEEMTDDVYNKLILLLQCYGMNEEIGQLTGIRSKIHTNRVALVDGENKRVKQFKSFSKDHQYAIKNFYACMFECGMYMRRWKGKGHPYPISADKTYDEKIDPFVLATPCLNDMKDMLKKDPWLRQTPMVNNGPDGYYVTSDLLERYFPGVYNGDTCIRMASTQFIATAERSLRVYAGERIPGFDSKEVSRIS